MQNLDTLKETLSRQNISMERFDVTADMKQGMFQGSRDGRHTAQENRGFNNGFQSAPATEPEPASNVIYNWEHENSLVNLVL